VLRRDAADALDVGRLAQQRLLALLLGSQDARALRLLLALRALLGRHQPLAQLCGGRRRAAGERRGGREHWAGPAQARLALEPPLCCQLAGSGRQRSAHP
jgi:hypothetical protein